MIHIQESVQKFKRYFAIHCFTHNRDLASKSELGNHKGCEVHYTDKNGSVDE